jgi:hypothetical protein
MLDQVFQLYNGFHELLLGLVAVFEFPYNIRINLICSTARNKKDFSLGITPIFETAQMVFS